MSPTDAVLVMLPNEDFKDRFEPMVTGGKTPSVQDEDEGNEEKVVAPPPAPSAPPPHAPSSDEEEVSPEGNDEAEDDEDSDEGSAQPSGGMETGRWSHEEHTRFLKGLDLYGRRKWQKIAELVRTRNTIQVRSHAQKYFKKIKKETEVVVVPPIQPYRRPTRLARGRQQQQQQQQEFVYLSARNDSSSSSQQQQQQRSFETTNNPKLQQQQQFEIGSQQQHGAFRGGGVPRQPQRRYTYNPVAPPSNRSSSSLKRRSYGDYPTTPFQLPETSAAEYSFEVDSERERRLPSSAGDLTKGAGEYQPKRRRSFSEHAFDDLCTIASSILLSGPSRPQETSQQQQPPDETALSRAAASRAYRATIESLDSPASTLRHQDHQQNYRGDHVYNMVVPAPASAFHHPQPPPMPATLTLPVPYRTKPFIIG